jgi:SAM-dependent methyltransferase
VALSNSWKKDLMFNSGKGAKHPPLYPNEYLVKCFSSDSYSFLRRHINRVEDLSTGRAPKVLEVGCFAGNNMRFFLDRGFSVYGCEVSEEIANVALENLIQAGYEDFSVVVGENLKLPFDDEYFDVLVSINTLHYSFGSEVEKALIEWKRVLKPGGIIFLESVGPDHFVREASERVELLNWLWGYDDFRKGQNFGFFDDQRHLEVELKKLFTRVETGRRIESYPLQALDFLIGIAQK